MGFDWCCATCLSRAPLKSHRHGQCDSVVQMELIKWYLCITRCLAILAILDMIRCYRKSQRQQKLKQALDIKGRSRESQDIQKILEIYKRNPGHRFLTRREQRIREVQLKKYLRKIWSQEGRRIDTKGTESAREDPAIKGISRMNRQLRQPSPSPQKPRISHLLHLLFIELCIHTALPLLTFCVFCHSLRISLRESYLPELEVEVEEESEDARPV